MEPIDLYWIANYEDGSKLKQFSTDASTGEQKENHYADINRNQLVRFDLINKQTEKPVYALYIREGEQLIFRRRTIKPVGKEVMIIYLVGYKQVFLTNSGPKVKIIINYIHPDGSIALDGSRDSLQLLDFEQ